MDDVNEDELFGVVAAARGGMRVREVVAAAAKWPGGRSAGGEWPMSIAPTPEDGPGPEDACDSPQAPRVS